MQPSIVISTEEFHVGTVPVSKKHRLERVGFHWDLLSPLFRCEDCGVTGCLGGTGELVMLKGPRLGFQQNQDCALVIAALVMKE